MKKQIIILFLALFNADLLWSQEFVKITTPCSAEFLRTVQGQWSFFGNITNSKITKQQQQEVFNRLDKIHQWIVNIYPSPLGIDAVWTRSTTDEYFAPRVKTEHFADGSTRDDHVNGIPVVHYSVWTQFCQYSCGRQSYEMVRGKGCEGGGQVFIMANEISILDQGGPEEMRINGRQIGMMPFVKGQWKGYPVYYLQAGGGASYVLLHREGMLPYTPVTRKQYLDLSIISISKMYDKMMADIDKDSKAFIDAGMIDAQTIKGNKEKLQKQKTDILKHYRDELTNTTAARLLESPAIISFAICDVDPTRPIFSSEEAGGRLLVTENPEYFRKDLPKYVPQLIVIKFDQGTWWFTPNPDPMIVVKENFPIEKLQAMIDK